MTNLSSGLPPLPYSIPKCLPELATVTTPPSAVPVDAAATPAPSLLPLK